MLLRMSGCARTGAQWLMVRLKADGAVVGVETEACDCSQKRAVGFCTVFEGERGSQETEIGLRGEMVEWLMLRGEKNNSLRRSEKTQVGEVGNTTSLAPPFCHS